MALLVVLGGCSDFFVEPARNETSLRLHISPTSIAQADTFKSADNGIVKLNIAGQVREKTFTFSPGQNEVRVQIEIDLPSGDASATLDVTLLRGSDQLFEGRQTLVIKKGVIQPVEVAVSAINYCERAMPISLGQTLNGRWVVDRDCVSPTADRVSSLYSLTLALPTVFQATLTTSNVNPSLAMRTGGYATGLHLGGFFRPSAGPLTVEVAFPAGSYWLLGSNITTPFRDADYLLSTSTRPEAQSASALLAETIVTYGTSISAQITSTDRVDPANLNPNVTLWVDGYFMHLQPGEAVNVTVRADFPVALTRWRLGSFQAGQFNIAAGETRTMTYSSVAAAGTTDLNSFYVISGQNRGTGNYTLSFARATAGTQPMIVLRSVTAGGAPANTSSLQGVVNATYGVTVPSAGAATALVGLLIANNVATQVCNVPITGTVSSDLQCVIDTRAVANGTYTLQARLVSPNGTAATASTQVTISNVAPPARVASVVVSPSNASVRVGATQQYTAVTRDSANNTLSGRAVTWSSSNTSIATVSAAGLVTGVAPGNAVITATAEGVIGTAGVTVTTPIATIEVSPSSASIEVNTTRQLTATARDAAGATVAGTTFTWSSSNTAVATVNSTGLVTAVAAGTATITAAADGRTGTASITVTAPCSLRTVTMGQTVSDVIPVSGCRIHTYDMTLAAGTNVAIDRTTGINEFVITTSDQGGLISTTVGSSVKYLNLAAGRYRFEVSGVNASSSGSYSFTFNTRQKGPGCAPRINSLSLAATVSASVTSNDCTYTTTAGVSDPNRRVDDYVRYFQAGQTVTFTLTADVPVGFELRQDTSPQVIVANSNSSMSHTVSYTVTTSGYYMMLIWGAATASANYAFTIR